MTRNPSILSNLWPAAAFIGAIILALLMPIMFQIIGSFGAGIVTVLVMMTFIFVFIMMDKKNDKSI